MKTLTIWVVQFAFIAGLIAAAQVPENPRVVAHERAALRWFVDSQR